jgi:hypothetical protein
MAVGTPCSPARFANAIKLLAVPEGGARVRLGNIFHWRRTVGAWSRGRGDVVQEKPHQLWRCHAGMLPPPGSNLRVPFGKRRAVAEGSTGDCSREGMSEMGGKRTSRGQEPVCSWERNSCRRAAAPGYGIFRRSP